MYEDDGKSLDYLHDLATWTRIRWDERTQTLTIEPDSRSKAKPMPQRKFDVLLVSKNVRKTVVYDGQKTQIKF
jgi:hypothetical protein